jgi:hypothetical protein
VIGEARSRQQIDIKIGSLFDLSDVRSRDEKEDNHDIK